MRNEKIRNIAIIAHVDHGKTTLVDALLKQAGVFRDGEETKDRLLDSMALERERGITITAKNCSLNWKGKKINILDTPGHADFGGEVERALSMVDGAILLVDAAEGPLPQTRFVVQKALERGLSMIVCINKIDRQDARIKEVLDEIYSLFIDLGASEEQIEFPVLFTVGRDGTATQDLSVKGKDLSPLFETIIECVQAPSYDEGKHFQMLVANISYSEFLGRLAIGKVAHGTARAGNELILIDENNNRNALKVVKLQSYQDIKIVETKVAEPGDIILLSGIDEVTIGDTICSLEVKEALPRIYVEPPTVAMSFSTNTSPFSGRDGKFIQAQKIYERLVRETLYNVSIQVEKTNMPDTFLVKARGELQLVVLIETMRREGYELSVGRPVVLYKYENEKKLEPIEHVVVDCEDEYTGVITSKLSSRKGILVNMHNYGKRTRLEFSVPSRSLIGFRDTFLTDTKGTGLMSSYLEGYEEYRGDSVSRENGSLVADREGIAVAYAIFHLEPRGKMFIVPGETFYKGMVIGERVKSGDLEVNPSKAKKLTNLRAAGKDENVILTPVQPMTIEKAIDFITNDELVEITPKAIRIRKKDL
ncbi:MAG: translational GTPase TypA [Bdellovibrionota bacterium]|jgi:GTP-binding protein